MGSSFLYQENPAAAESPPLYEEGGGRSPTAIRGEKKTSPVSFADSPLLIEGAFVRCA